MEPERKHFTLELKDADGETGDFIAKIASLGVIDKDEDVTLPGAFPKGKSILVSAYGHASWQGALPVGRAVISERKGEALAEGTFWLETTIGRDTYLTVKNAGDLQEWSYGFMAKEFSFGEQDGQRVRFLKSVDPFEISPVLVGAGEDTRTLAIKSGGGTANVALPDAYAEQGDVLLESLAAYEGRTLRRIHGRAKGGRLLSEADIERWEQLRDMATRVLGRVVDQTKSEQREVELSEEQQRAMRTFVEFERLRAAMNGVSV